jgi:hypothetical protein
MPEDRYIHRDGTPVRSGICVMPDNWTTTFSVTLRSLTPAQAEAVRTLLQTKYEVVSIEKTDALCVVTNEPF